MEQKSKVLLAVVDTEEKRILGAVKAVSRETYLETLT